MKVVVLIDIEALAEKDPQLKGHIDSSLTEVEYHVTEALRHMGHEVTVLALDENVTTMIEKLTKEKPDLVFNLTEHLGGDRHKDFHIVALLEMLNIPYTGAGPKGLMLCRDKAMCKRILSHHHVRVPSFLTCPTGKTRSTRTLRYPLIVKPLLEDGSDGISMASVVKDATEINERVRILHEKVNGPAIVEEYIEGRELYVGVIGNSQLTVLPPRELNFGHNNGGPEIATSRVKLDEAYRDKWKITFTRAKLSQEVVKKVEVLVKRIYRLLCMRDYGRIDMRLTPDNDIYFLEANPNPDLTMGDELAESAEHAGIEYEDLIARIVSLATKRTRRA